MVEKQINKTITRGKQGCIKMIDAGCNQEAANVGRKHTELKMPW
jgi:hypothetical protein